MLIDNRPGTPRRWAHDVERPDPAPTCANGCSPTPHAYNLRKSGSASDSDGLRAGDAAKLTSEAGKARYAKRRETVEPAIKTLDDFDFSFQRSVRKQVVLHLAQLDFLREASNVVFLGPPVIHGD